MTQAREFFIGFNGAQILVKTDVPVIAEYLLESHQWLMVSEITALVGELTAFRSSNGVECRGLEYIEYGGPVDALFPWISRDLLERFMRANRHLSWLHAGVVHKEGRALILAGSPAQGKSTLATRLVRSGWRFMSDEMAPIEPGSDLVLAYPRTPVPRMDPGREIKAEATIMLQRETCVLPAAAIHLFPTSIAAFVFPKFAYGTGATVTAIGPGETALELAANCVSFLDDSGSAVSRIAGMARRLPGYVLNYGNAVGAAGLLDRLSLES